MAGRERTGRQRCGLSAARRHRAEVPRAADLVRLITGLRPAAALTAGGIAAAFSVHAALLVRTALHVVPAGLLWFSPVRRLTAMPTPTPAKDDAR
ncbi:hypothetical protein [Streptomyces kanasensis]|uniref:hypothetical protein n=1 Tax=Streptomyces kanasensis TaxID=936756 RepID=UPI003829D33A